MSRVDVAGKLVILGEYAVLDGAPALVWAVDAGVSCHTSPSPILEIDTPTGDARFVRAALIELGAPAAHYVFEDRAGWAFEGKPGLGGSAAAVVAALVAGGFTGTSEELFALASRVHRNVQGSGSGLDVAASTYGGGIRFRAGRVTPVELPTPIVIYSGHSASTGPRVQQYLSWSQRKRFVADSERWIEHFQSQPILSIRSAWRGLQRMASIANISYTTPDITTIVEIAERHAGAAKPSGAGGGDIVIAYVPEPAPFQIELQQRGYSILPLSTGSAPARYRSL